MPRWESTPGGTLEGYWGERYGYVQFGAGRYLEAVYLPFAGVFKPKDLDRSHFPSADWFDFSPVKAQCEAIDGEYAVCFGTAGDMDFINSIARATGIDTAGSLRETIDDYVLRANDTRESDAHGKINMSKLF